MTRMSFTIDISVTDAAALHAAARQHLLDNAVDECCLAEMIGDADRPNLGGCVLALFDPGQSPPGTQIEDSGTTIL